METNRTWKHYQLEERVTRAQTYIFVFFGGGRGICECRDLFLFLSFEGFHTHKRRCFFPLHIVCGFTHGSHQQLKKTEMHEIMWFGVQLFP